ncbi:dioxygenase family protein [Kangiella sediminilitoris]|uniref:Extradiol ring-cleavage dioxygenase n=1 Tax=Kangiella sediminilitoris TaxID=1144748 RepID=A0A1B3B9H2_9GAMM|nr:class III extradiol ring-cleavage dioxygenase [Kangiella sediminilitoris]AOE49454.1 extradiol ring-cleavage dioxygenase [Kangiella sediminilitoris]
MSKYSTMPTLFLSHGSPMLAVQDNDTTQFFTSLGQLLPRPKAIVIFSAHYDESDSIHITSGSKFETIHDFNGFPKQLYEIQYPASGDFEIARAIAENLSGAGYHVTLDGHRGLDHGAWVPLKWIYPEADIPIVQVSINSRLDTQYHYQLGQELKGLRQEGILFIGSGGITHNLRAYFKAASEPNLGEKAEAFNGWVHETLTQGRHSELLDYQSKAPFAAFNHPYPEHFYPLLCMVGLTHPDEPISRLHHSMENHVLSLDAYQSGSPLV